MTVFWLIVAVLLIAALLFVLPPLLGRGGKASGAVRATTNAAIYRDQLADLARDLKNDVLTAEQYEQSKRELERRLVEDVTGEEAPVPPAVSSGRWTAVVVGLLIPGLAIGLYLKFGKPEAMDTVAVKAATAGNAQAPGTEHANNMQQVEQMVQALVTKLKDHPEDIEGWAVLARSLSALQRYDDANVAFERVLAINPNNPDVLADYADTLAMASGESLMGKPSEMLQLALKINPRHIKALWLAGTAEFEAGRYPGAVQYWERLQHVAPQNSDAARSIAESINEAKGLMMGNKGMGALSSLPSSPTPAAAVGGAQISGTIRLSPEFAARVSPGDTVYIYARAPQGPPMPLAVDKKSVRDLPYKFTLDESMSPMPQMSLAGASQVIVEARVSKSGNAMTQPGDLRGTSAVVNVGSQAVDIVISNVVP